MDFLQSMGYSKVSRSSGNGNSITGGSSSSLKVGTSLLGSFGTNTQVDTTRIKNNLGLPVLIKICNLDSEYKILNNNKSDKVKCTGKQTIKFVIPYVDNKIYFEKGKKNSITLDIESNKKHEISDYISQISTENLVFYNEQKIKMRSLDNSSREKSRTSTNHL